MNLEDIAEKVLANPKIFKRLRYTQALFKIGTEPTEKQAIMLMTDIVQCAVDNGVDVRADTEGIKTFSGLFVRLMKEAWDSSTLEENMLAMKIAQDNLNARLNKPY